MGRRPANRQYSRVPNSDPCLEHRPVATTEWELTTPSAADIRQVKKVSDEVSDRITQFKFLVQDDIRRLWRTCSRRVRNRRGSKVLAKQRARDFEALRGSVRGRELFWSDARCARGSVRWSDTRPLRGHYAVTTRSLRGHYAVTTRSLRGHYAVTTRSRYGHHVRGYHVDNAV